MSPGPHISLTSVFTRPLKGLVNPIASRDNTAISIDVDKPKTMENTATPRQPTTNNDNNDKWQS